MLNTKYLPADARASVVVFLVALPLCLGISLASGAPLFSGLLAGIIGGIVVGFFSHSHTSVSGPAAGLTVIVLSGIESLGSFQTFTLAVLISGVLQILLGYIKAGEIGAYFPNSVIKGMLAAIGLILILKQIPHFVGLDKDFMGDEAFMQADGMNTFSEIYYALGAIHWGAFIVAITSLVSMLVWNKLAAKGIKFFALVPSALFAVLFGVAINQVLIASGFYPITGEHLVSLPLEGGMGSFFNLFEMPNWSAFTNPLVYKVAVTLAIVASIETLLSIEAVDKIDTHKRSTNKNKELVAQGIGNSIAGLVGALPVTSVIVRSSANVSANGMTKLSAILHGIWLFLAVVFIPKYIEMIPLASLAAVLILVGYKLCTPALFKEMAAKGKNQLIPFVITILAILLTDLLVGITIGILVGLFFVIKSSYSNSIVVVSDDKDYLIRFMKDVSFLQKPRMKKILDELPENSNVVIDGSNHFSVDTDIIAIIEEFLSVCEERNIRCEIVKSTMAMNPFFRS